MSDPKRFSVKDIIGDINYQEIPVLKDLIITQITLRNENNISELLGYDYENSTQRSSKIFELTNQLPILNVSVIDNLGGEYISVSEFTEEILFYKVQGAELGIHLEYMPMMIRDDVLNSGTYRINSGDIEIANFVKLSDGNSVANGHSFILYQKLDQISMIEDRFYDMGMIQSIKIYGDREESKLKLELEFLYSNSKLREIVNHRGYIMERLIIHSPDWGTFIRYSYDKVVHFQQYNFVYGNQETSRIDNGFFISEFSDKTPNIYYRAFDSDQKYLDETKNHLQKYKDIDVFNNVNIAKIVLSYFSDLPQRYDEFRQILKTIDLASDWLKIRLL